MPLPPIRSPSSRRSERGRPSFHHCERGQGAVELVAVLPLIALLVAVAAQLLVAGHAVWSAGAAARAAARAHAVGGDAARAARATLPRRLESRLRVVTEAGGEVRVTVRVPPLAPGLDLGTVTARSHLEPQS